MPEYKIIVHTKGGRTIEGDLITAANQKEAMDVAYFTFFGGNAPEVHGVTGDRQGNQGYHIPASSIDCVEVRKIHTGSMG